MMRELVSKSRIVGVSEMVAATCCCSWCLLQTEMWHIKYGLMIGRSQDTGWQREIRILDICVDYMYFTSINKIYVRPTLERWISHLWSYNLFSKFYEWDFSLLCSSKSKYKPILTKVKWNFFMNNSSEAECKRYWRFHWCFATQLKMNVLHAL